MSANHFVGGSLLEKGVLHFPFWNLQKRRSFQWTPPATMAQCSIWGDPMRLLWNFGDVWSANHFSRFQLLHSWPHGHEMPSLGSRLASKTSRQCGVSLLQILRAADFERLVQQLFGVFREPLEGVVPSAFLLVVGCSRGVFLPPWWKSLVVKHSLLRGAPIFSQKEAKRPACDVQG